MATIYRVIQIKLNHLSLRKYPHDHGLTNKAYLSAITVTNISQSLTYKWGTIWRKKSTGIDREQKYVTFTLCIYMVGGVAQ